MPITGSYQGTKLAHHRVGNTLDKVDSISHLSANYILMRVMPMVDGFNESVDATAYPEDHEEVATSPIVSRLQALDAVTLDFEHHQETLAPPAISISTIAV